MKAIVTTTIQPPTSATLKFAAMNDWTLFVVGDTKTPHDEYKKLESMKAAYPAIVYLDCETQDKLYPELSAVIGWKTIQRRNVGFVHAYNMGAEVIATVDDDNIPYKNWGWNTVGQYNDYVDSWDCETEVFDPFSVTEYKNLWHRGFPLQLVKKKNNVTYLGQKSVKPAVQADLWDGDPDIDALIRITQRPCAKFDSITKPFKGPGLTVFDSQNTFLSRDCFPYYFVMPFVGRMDDIFGGYYMQIMKPDLQVVFGPASVYQERNVQDLTVNLKKEYIGYEHAFEFIHILKSTGDLRDCKAFIPQETIDFHRIYTQSFKI